MSDTITLLVGTTKGAFLMRSDGDRLDWSLSGPHCDGWGINHMTADAATGQIWAVGGGAWSGAGVWRSEDQGASWTLTQLASGERETWITENPDEAKRYGLTPSDPGPFTGDIEALWSVTRAHGRLFVGAKPANLFVSDDDGASWAPVDGLNKHESRESWHPGGAGLTLHSIVAHPEDSAKLWLGISAAGMFATEDGGATWDRRNRRANSSQASVGDGDPFHNATEVGVCIHNFARARTPGDLLYQQNHHGVFRSADGGRSWHEITAGLPSSFGFPIAVDPHNPHQIWTLPLNGDSDGRYPPDASAKVWRSRDGGDSWTAVSEGLPQQNCYFTVLRQAMATDQSATAGLYFGTNTGSIFSTADHGDTWREIARHLPTVLCVECLHQPS